MTNEEWLKGLSTEAFFRILNCSWCPENTYDINEPCSENCEKFIEWLKSERETENEISVNG